MPLFEWNTFNESGQTSCLINMAKMPGPGRSFLDWNLSSLHAVTTDNNSNSLNELVDPESCDICHWSKLVHLLKSSTSLLIIKIEVYEL